MKSLLVDALRQASENDNDADSIKTDPNPSRQAEVSQSTDSEPGYVAGELRLQDSVEAELEIDEHSIDSDSEDECDTEDSKLTGHATLPQFPAVESRVAESPLMRLARFSPLFSLLLLSAAAGGHLLYQHLNAADLNNDLAAISSQHNRLDLRKDILEPSAPVSRFNFTTPPAVDGNNVDDADALGEEEALIERIAQLKRWPVNRNQFQ